MGWWQKIGVSAALSVLLGASASKAQDVVEPPPPGLELGDGVAVTAETAVQIERSARVQGDVRSNGDVSLGNQGEIDGDITLAGTFTNSGGTVTGVVTQVAPEPLPEIPTEAEARAQADRVFEGDAVFADTRIDDVVFVAGTATLRGSIAGDGTIFATSDLLVEPLDLWVFDPSNHPIRLTLVAFQGVTILENPQMRGTVLAGTSIVVDRNVTFQGTLTSHGTVVVRPNSTITFESFDETPPEILSVTPADGAFVPTATVEISTSYTDDISGVDPQSVVLNVDGVDRTAEATVTAEQVVLPAGPVLSEGGHTVTVTIADRFGNSSARTWGFVVDTLAPSLGFTEPSQPVLWNDPAPQLALAFADATSGLDLATLEVSLDDASITASCTPAATGAVCAAQELPLGVHTAEAAIRDRAGHEATATLTFETRQDLTAPQVSLATPAAGALLPTGAVEVTGTVTDDGEVVSLLVNGQPAVLEGDAFALAVEIPEGVAVLEALAEDATGKRGSAAVVVTVDETAPTVVLTEPDETLTNAPTARVAGEVSDTSPITAVTVAGQPAVLEGSRFEAEVALNSGPNVLIVEATDQAGHVGRVERIIELFRLPGIRILEPLDLATVAATTVAVGGIVEDSLGNVEVNGVAAEVFSDGTFVALDVPLVEGGNVLTATLLASDGAVNTASVHVVRDLTPPRVAVTTPVEGSTVSTPTVAVSGLVNDIVAGTVNQTEASVTVNGVAATVRNRNFLAADVPLDLGENVLEVTAVDESGNVGRATAVVVREDAAGRPRLEKAAGDLQEGVVRTELPGLLQVVVRGADGTPLAGRTVAFEEAGGGGSLGASGARRAAVTTDAQGVASVRWTLGRRAGVQRVRANAVGVRGAVVFTALASTGGPAFIVVDAGGQQRGVAGQPLPRPLIATVTDGGFNRLGGVPVQFDVVKGAGHLGTGEASKIVETDSDGRAVTTLVLDPAEGVANNVVTARIGALLAGPVASFTASGLAAGPAEATAVTGVVLDNTNQPLPGVTIRIEGTSLLARTDAQGQFRIEGAPVGDLLLLVDGSTADRPGVWASLEFRLTTIPGRDNDVGMPIFLLPLDVAGGLFVDEVTGGVLTVPEVPGLSLEVLPGSVTFPGGSKSGVVSVTVVHSDRVPMVPNFGQQPRLIVTIQPAGARFDPPARITYPNVEGLAPGESTDLYSFDHDLGHFVSIGPGTVSDDGTMLVSDPGVGILKAGWHCGGDPQSETGTPHNCPECQRCEGTACVPDDGGPCDDEDGCTADDHCSGGACMGGGPITISGVDATGNGLKSVEEVLGVEIQFSAGAAIQTNCEAPLEYRWNFGDGSSSQERNPIHAYEEEGTYTAHLTVKCPTCAAATKTDKVAVRVVCPEVEIVAADPDVSYICPGCEVQYTAETDPPGRPVYWRIPPFGGLGGKATISSSGLLSIAADAPDGIVAVQASALPDGSACSDTRTVRVFAPPNEELNSDNRTPGEEAWILNNKWCAFWEVSNLKRECTNMTTSHIGKPLDGTKENAWQHAYCNCVTASRCGEQVARRLWDAHEDYEGNPCPHASMDLHNNEVGRQVATEDETLQLH